MARLRTPIYLEVNSWMHGFLDVLDDVFGEAQVCHIVRHPGRQVTSYVNFGVFRGMKGAVAKHVPYWFLKPEYGEANPALGSAAVDG